MPAFVLLDRRRWLVLDLLQHERDLVFQLTVRDFDENWESLPVFLSEHLDLEGRTVQLELDKSRVGVRVVVGQDVLVDLEVDPSQLLPRVADPVRNGDLPAFLLLVVEHDPLQRVHHVQVAEVQGLHRFWLI